MEFRDTLQIEGVNAWGFGSIAKMVMVDRCLTVESKAIYSYFCSFAGGGKTAFPGVPKICEDLDISEDTYYFHFAYLKAYGYIKVEQRTDERGKFKSNLYTLVQNPVANVELIKAIEEKKNKRRAKRKNKAVHPSPKNSGTVKKVKSPSPNFPGTEKPSTESSGTNINNTYKNNNIFEKKQSINIDGQEKISFILKNSEVEFYAPDHAELIKETVEDLYYNPEFANKNNLPHEVVKARLNKLDKHAISIAIDNWKSSYIHNNTVEVNPLNYFRKVLWNSITESKLA